MPLLLFAPLLLLFAALLGGCTRPAAFLLPAPSAVTADPLAAGVVHRAIPTGADAGVDVIDVDLRRSRARPAIVTGNVQAGFGASDTPEGWLAATHALAAVNGGYFGAGDTAGNEAFVGLLVRHGRVVQAARPLTGRGSATLAPGRFVRSAFGVSRAGIPTIVWAATAPHLLTYKTPLITGQQGRPWHIWDAVGCGPTLIHAGLIVVTDRRERLASPGPLPRTFVAYDGPPGHPQHFVLGIASAMEFADLAAFLQNYFPRYDGTRAQAAMCLDGGASTQFSYRLGSAVHSPRYTGVAVPDAVEICLP